MAQDKTMAKGMFIRERKSKYDPFLNVNVTKEFIDFYEQHKDENGQLSIDIFKKKEANEKGITHYAVLNEYKKDAESPL